uniref:Uncharacterized protein n=1 Tax=Panagrolaimus sp. JU765 TaxID=591449 RepID=A0AC34RSV2_9BILA
MMIQLFVILVFINFCHASNDVDLCKRKPYLLFCRSQASEFDDSRMNTNQDSELPLARPKIDQGFDIPQDPITLAPIPDPRYDTDYFKPVYSPPRYIYHHKDANTPIDMSRPNADDVAHEMESRRRDEPLNPKFEPSLKVKHPTNEFLTIPRTFSRYKRSTNQTPNKINQIHKNATYDKKLKDWIYEDDADDMAYRLYRLRRARLMRKIRHLDDYEISRRGNSEDLYDTTPYYRYRPSSYYPQSSYYPCCGYTTGYPSYGYPSGYGGWNPGYLGGYGAGYGGPFTFGIGSGLNIGIPYVGPISVGSGLGVVVG